MKKLFFLFVLLSISSPCLAAGPDIIWTGGSLRISNEDKPNYSAETLISLGYHESTAIFFDPIVTARGDKLGIDLGIGTRSPLFSGEALFGYNVFFDYADTYDHKRMGMGTELYFPKFSAHTNIYLPLPDSNHNQEALAGIDATIGIPIPWAAFITIWPGIYYYNGNDQDDLKGLNFMVSAQPIKAVTLSIGGRNDTLCAGKEDNEIFARVDITIPMRRLTKNPFKFTSVKYPIDVGQYMDHRIMRENFITYEKK